MNSFTKISVFLAALSLFACGEEAPENLIDYQKPQGISLTPNQIEGVWNGPFEKGERVNKAVEAGEPIYSKVGVRIEQTRMTIQLRCFYKNLQTDKTTSADTWSTIPITIEKEAKTVTVRATSIMEARPEGAPMACRYSVSRNSVHPYVIKGTSMNLQGDFGIFVEKRADN